MRPVLPVRWLAVVLGLAGGVLALRAPAAVTWHTVLRQPAGWYASDEAAAIADRTVLLAS